MLGSGIASSAEACNTIEAAKSGRVVDRNALDYNSARLDESMDWLYVAAADYWRKLISALDLLRKRLRWDWSVDVLQELGSHCSTGIQGSGWLAGRLVDATISLPRMVLMMDAEKVWVNPLAFEKKQDRYFIASLGKKCVLLGEAGDDFWCFGRVCHCE